MADIIVAIDGYSACGKSTTARLVAERLNYTYIDTGAMYRAVTLYFLDYQVNAMNKTAIRDALDNCAVSFQINPETGTSEIYLNGEHVEKDIRSVRVSEKVSVVSALPEVRKRMTTLQRQMGKDKKIVMDGRDIGTTVFPEAELKVFMKADMEVRARRRLKEMQEKGISVSMKDVIKNIERRDQLDTSRKESPLTQSPEAVVLDTSEMTVDQQVDFVVSRAEKIISSL